jgi:N-acetylmuramoyl-L-alanine amidase
VSITTVILDPGHGLGNRKTGVFDPGAVSGGVREADIVMDWANEIRAFLRSAGYKVIRTRINNQDPAPVSERAVIARQYKGDVMLSIHCNAFNGTAHGTETVYRGEANKAKAEAINKAVVDVLGTRTRGAKLESAGQHGRLAVMAFQPTFLVELGFIDNPEDRAKMLDSDLRARACEALAQVIVV